MKTGHHLTLWQVFGAPVLIAALSLFGLIAALLGDGAWDAIGAAALALIALGLWIPAPVRQVLREAAALVGD